MARQIPRSSILWQWISNFGDCTLPLIISLLLLPVPLLAVAAPSSREVAQTPAASTQDIRQLEQGKLIERQITGSETHSYQLTIHAGQYLQVAVQQQGIDLVVTLFAPDGEEITEVDYSLTSGSELVQEIVETSGTYLIKIQPFKSSAASGSYKVKIEELREATSQDKKRLIGQEAFKEADELESEETAEARQQAIEKYKYALTFFQKANDRNWQARTLNNIGSVYEDLGEKQKAIDYYNQAVPLLQAVGDRSEEANTLENIGLLYANLRENQKALDYFNRTLSLRHGVGDKSGEAQSLNNISLLYTRLGEIQKALDYSNQALSIFRALGDLSGEAQSLNNISLYYERLGEIQKALDYSNQALSIFRALGDLSRGTTLLNNIGSFYLKLGANQKALDYYNQALLISLLVGNRSEEVTTLYNIGGVYYIQGNKQKALEYYNQALSLNRELSDRSREATILTGIGGVYYIQGNKQKALEYYNQALSLNRELSDRSGEAITLSNIGLVYYTLGERQKALDYYNQALPLLKGTGSGEAYNLASFAIFERDRGNLKEALSYIQKAIEIIESLRTKVISQELRTSFFASAQDYYQFYIDLLMQLHKQNPSEGFDGKAFESSESARARSLLELLTEANADIRQGVDSDLLQKERSLQAQLNAVEQQRIKILSGNHTEEQAKELETQLLNLQAQYQEIQTEIRAKSPKYAALTQPQPLKLPEIQQQVLDDNTILLEYSLGEERSYLWAVTKTGITSYELPKRADIEAAATQFRQVLTDPVRSQDFAEVAKTATQLSQLILAPVANQLGEKRLLIVGDGALQYVPFAALVKPGNTLTPSPSPIQGEGSNIPYEPLIVKHEIVYSPSASTIAISRRELKGRTPAPKTIAMLADPVFTADDERVNDAGNSRGRGVEGQTNRGVEDNDELASLQLERSVRNSDVNLKRLPFTRQEAQAIMTLVSATDREQVFDFEASRSAATSSQLSQYRIVHFATHGILNPTNPELSGLVMSLVDKDGNSQNGFLRLSDIFNLKLPAELVVLSACKTGSGQIIRGEGIVGLTRGFIYAGAARVVASLWSVNDPATAELMTQFYQKYLKEGKPAATALRAAQLKMWKQQQWNAPYYWAAFTLQGEWR